MSTLQICDGCKETISFPMYTLSTEVRTPNIPEEMHFHGRTCLESWLNERNLYDSDDLR